MNFFCNLIIWALFKALLITFFPTEWSFADELQQQPDL